MTRSLSSHAESVRHPLLTRLFHACFALAILTQLLTSLGMEPPRGGRPANALFNLHEFSGLVAFGLAFLFWLSILIRRRGTPLGALFPWFSARRRAAFMADLIAHVRAGRQLRLPPHVDGAAFPAAIHGLGLLLMSFMAVSGTTFFLMVQSGVSWSYARPVIELHALFGNLAWVYLIGHAGMALVHHVTNSQPITAMWSLRS
ncbi:cytochrome b/b6 domain-containing protein [Acidimangrovimonas pyrenivorans]|uniref:Cytochrome b/b6 domain-containing protein n=1 Tax=Acidimangrovimonas pyrenivorans TaxID=2030798 RepID=A0ABV7AK21_9RHOB